MSVVRARAARARAQGGGRRAHLYGHAHFARQAAARTARRARLREAARAAALWLIY